MVNGISGNNPIKKPIGIGEPIKLPSPGDNGGSIFPQDPGFNKELPPINDPGFNKEVPPINDPGYNIPIKNPNPIIKDPGDLGGALPKEPGGVKPLPNPINPGEFPQDPGNIKLPKKPEENPIQYF